MRRTHPALVAGFFVGGPAGRGATGSLTIAREGINSHKVSSSRAFVERARNLFGVATRWISFMVKLLRACGGCPGVSRRRRTWLAAKSLGESQAGVDPRMSEWGNPSGVNTGYSSLNT